LVGDAAFAMHEALHRSAAVNVAARRGRRRASLRAHGWAAMTVDG
jgi:hypothetical protein